MLTVYFNKERTNKQVIKLSDKFFEKKSYYEARVIASTIAFDLSGGSYHDFELETN